MNPAFTVTKVLPAYWRITLDNPPLNLFDPDMRGGFRKLIDEMEADTDLKVVVFDTANPDFFMAHVDLARLNETDDVPGPTGLEAWPDFTERLHLAPFISIASVRGRARGVGSEFIQAVDIRFASREKAIFAQLEIGMGLIPGGGGMERLWRITGVPRALEIIVSGDDYDATTAELYGWINRAVPDAELDGFVDRFARRLASFDQEALREAKSILNVHLGSTPHDELTSSFATFLRLMTKPANTQRLQDLFAEGLQTAGDLEYNMGERLGPDSHAPMPA